jgi:hypothetical protein
VIVRTWRRRLVAGAGCVVALVGCTSTFEPVDSVAAPPSGPPTTTTLPHGTLEDLLARLVGEVEMLSERVVENQGDSEALARIEALWLVVSDDVERDRPDLRPDFAAAMGLARRSVERRRPADADKAANNLQALIHAYENGTPSPPPTT